MDSVWYLCVWMNALGWLPHTTNKSGSSEMLVLAPSAGSMIRAAASQKDDWASQIHYLSAGTHTHTLRAHTAFSPPFPGRICTHTLHLSIMHSPSPLPGLSHTHLDVFLVKNLRTCVFCLEKLPARSQLRFECDEWGSENASSDRKQIESCVMGQKVSNLISIPCCLLLLNEIFPWFLIFMINKQTNSWII